MGQRDRTSRGELLSGMSRDKPEVQTCAAAGTASSLMLESGKQSSGWIGRFFKWTVLTLFVGACLTTLTLALRENAAQRDYLSYWSTAKLLVAHANPYDRAAVLRLERGAGYTAEQPLLMRNLPWSLFLAAPLGFLSTSTGALLWVLANILSSLASVFLLQRIWQARPPLTAFLFAPVLVCAMAGQTSVFALLGACLFFRLEERRPIAAGMALTLLAVKPHLAVLFWVALILNEVRQRRARVLGGLAAALLVESLFAVWLDPKVWIQYAAAMRAERVQTLFLPNLSFALRIVSGPKHVWIQFLPLVAGLGLAFWYWRSRAQRWRWAKHGAVLLMISVLVSPYSWLMDQALCLPALVYYHLYASRTAGAVLGTANILLLALVYYRGSLDSLVYLWAAPFWVLWCGYVHWHELMGKGELRLEGQRSSAR